MKNDHLIIIGNCSIDNVLKADGVFYQSICGGNCFHASMAAGIITSNVAILTCIPKNYPQSNIEKLVQHGIDTSLIKKQEEDVDWEELFIYQENGDRIDGLFIKPIDNQNGFKLTKAEIDKLISDSRKDVYSYGDFRAQFEPELNTIPKDWNISSVHLAPTALSVHKKILEMDISIKTLDPGRYLLDLSYEEIKEIVSKTTIFAPSKKELSWIFPNREIIDAVFALGRDCKTNIVCKNGKDGAVVYIYEQDKCYKVGTFPEKKVENLTGAGDSFCGAMNAALYRGFSVLDAVRIATVVAAKAIEVVSAVDRNKINFEFVLNNYCDVCFEEVHL